MPIIRTQKIEVKLKRPLAEIPKPEFTRGLLQSPTFTWLPKVSSVVEGKELVSDVAAKAPTDGREIVPWMQEAAAYSAVLEAMAEEYSRAGSFFSDKVGDGLIPGVGIGSGSQAVKFESVDAEQVGSTRGAYFVVGTTRFLCPEYGSLTAAVKDVLAWAAIPGKYYRQWLAALVRWLKDELAKTPINDRIRFGGLNGLIAPNFFVVGSQFPPPAMMMSIGLTSDRQQKVGMVMRSSDDFTNVLNSDTLDIPAGESVVDYFILGLPFVEPFVLQLQPENNSETILDSLTVTPP
jgi:hypothetical protein